MDATSINPEAKGACPFTLPSGEASGTWFVGRREVIDKIVRTVIQPDGRLLNYYLIGLPRIGKSSLLTRLLDDEALHARYDKLLTIYVSIDQCTEDVEMWQLIGRQLQKVIKRRQNQRGDLSDMIEDLEWEEYTLDKSQVIDYDYVHTLSSYLYKYGFRVLLLLDEFDNFPSFADKGTVGQFRTLVSDARSAIRAIVASRRSVARIEKEVKGAINDNVSILDPIFHNGERLKGFNADEMDEYWAKASQRLGKTITKEYRDFATEYAGNHPMLLNLFNFECWNMMDTDAYLWQSDSARVDMPSDVLYRIHDAYVTNVWADLERWGLISDLVLLTWGPAIDIDEDHLRELTRYGMLSEPRQVNDDGPLRVSISPYITEWIRTKRCDLPYGDIWSITEKKLRDLVAHYCYEIYDSDEDDMIKDIRGIQVYGDVPYRYTPKGRIEEMIKRRDEKRQKYPHMSSSVIAYSEPSDIQEIFLKRQWKDWFVDVFSGNWYNDWKDKFDKIIEIRNFKAHGNEGVPLVEINKAKEYCNNICDCIDAFFARIADE